MGAGWGGGAGARDDAAGGGGLRRRWLGRELGVTRHGPGGCFIHVCACECGAPIELKLNWSSALWFNSNCCHAEAAARPRRASVRIRADARAARPARRKRTASYVSSDMQTQHTQATSISTVPSPARHLSALGPAHTHGGTSPSHALCHSYVRAHPHTLASDTHGRTPPPRASAGATAAGSVQ